MSLQSRNQIYQNYNASLIPIPSRNQSKLLSIVTNGDSNNYESDSSFTELQQNSLPTIATANDVREIVRFLQHFPAGVTFPELVSAEPRRIFDARKIAAYEFWRIVKSDGKRIELTELGREMAKTIEPEKCVYREILRSVPAYATAIEWIELQGLKIVTHFEIVNFWRQAHPELQLADEDEKDVEAMVVSFFSLCHNAEIGTMTVGKRGQPARLRIEFERMRTFLENAVENNLSKIALVKDFAITNSLASLQRVYLSANKQHSSLNQLREILELADFECVIADNIRAENNFIPRSQLTIMNQCQAGIFLLDDESCTFDLNGSSLKNDVLIEINSALTLYDWRVVICWLDHREPPLELKSNGLDFIRSESLDWETNFRLVQSLKNIKSKQ